MENPSNSLEPLIYLPISVPPPPRASSRRVDKPRAPLPSVSGKVTPRPRALSAHRRDDTVLSLCRRFRFDLRRFRRPPLKGPLRPPEFRSSGPRVLIRIFSGGHVRPRAQWSPRLLVPARASPRKAKCARRGRRADEEAAVTRGAPASR